MAIDINKEIRRAVDTGKVLFGTKESETSINGGQARLLIATSNAQKLLKERILEKAKIAKTPIIEFNGTALELGQVCGKPFNVSFMTILEAGKSTILKEQKEKIAKSKQLKAMRWKK